MLYQTVHQFIVSRLQFLFYLEAICKWDTIVRQVMTDFESISGIVC